MLPSNFIRSASYEALPNHRSFAAKSGLTSRLLVRNRYLWEEADETATISLGKAKCT